MASSQFVSLDRLVERIDGESGKGALERMRVLYEKRLWYQLTSAVQEFVELEETKPVRLDLWQNFITSFLEHINQLRAVEIAVICAQSCPTPSDAQAFLETLSLRHSEADNEEAWIMGTMECTHYKIIQGSLDQAKESISQCRLKLDHLDNADQSVHASFYRVNSEYHKAKAEYSDYYATSLLYLACIDLQQGLSAADRLSRAHDLAISALLGSTTYNFGELLMHPILDALEDSEWTWLRNLLFAFNSGNIGQFEALLPNFASQPALQENYAFLRQKVCLMALIESVFKRPPGARVIAFDTIAAETKLPPHEVEHLVMKALSLKLILGTLDQVNRVASVSWVQSRVLDKSQIRNLDDRLAGWSDKVTQTGIFASQENNRIDVSRSGGELAVH